jgi:hypothetical protein
MPRREYSISIEFNFKRINKVIIDPHYEEKHAESITDEIILALVKKLDGLIVIPDDVSPPYAYFTEDKMEFNGKLYKLVWLLEDDQIYIGVVNAHRR